MVQLDLKKLFAAQREIPVISETVNFISIGDEQAPVLNNPPLGTSKSLREAKLLWTGITFCTYNCEHLSEARLMQITREMETQHVQILCVQGTRNKFAGDRTMNGFKVFYEQAGDHKQESYAGVAIIVAQALLEKNNIRK